MNRLYNHSNGSHSTITLGWSFSLVWTYLSTPIFERFWEQGAFGVFYERGIDVQSFVKEQ